jgi:hypothetical protein
MPTPPPKVEIDKVNKNIRGVYKHLVDRMKRIKEGVVVM